MRSVFPGFPAEGLAFFSSLQRNNRREWFQPRKAIFEATMKQPMRELVGAVNSAMKSFAPDYVTDPDKAIYRIYRDTRFSKDKTPYKDHLAASFSRRGDKAGAGFYFAVSHKEVAIGGGIYMPEPETLRAMRQHVAEHHEEFRKIAGARAVRQLFTAVQGEQLIAGAEGLSLRSPRRRHFAYEAIPVVCRAAAGSCDHAGTVRRSGQTFSSDDAVCGVLKHTAPRETQKGPQRI